VGPMLFCTVQAPPLSRDDDVSLPEEVIMLKPHSSLSLLLLVATAVPTLLAAQRPLSAAGRSVVYAPHGIVATSQPLASSAGLAVLQAGGNAIDAAVTAAAVLSVTEPMMTGMGGDMFATVWVAKEHRLVAINASGRAGALMTRDALLARGRKQMPDRGAETVTVPGALAGWDELLKKYGTISLAKALAPAIRYAEQGYPVTPIISGDWKDEEATLAASPSAKATFMPNGHTPVAGEWFRNPDYARTLREVAAGGSKVLYGGALGQRIVKHVQALGGFLTLDDLKANKPTWETPISVVFKGYRIWELPPNNQGIATLEMLKILEPYDLKAMGHNSAPYLHHLIEAKKLAYADLARYVGDADHLDIPPERMLSSAFIAERRSHMDESHAQVHVDPGPAQTASETIYLTTADSAGNMVSFINSLYSAFGSGIVVPGTGFALQNRGAGFTMQPGLPNTVAPGKRPFHTLIPGFVTKPGASPTADGRSDTPYMSFGLMGGAMQAQGHAQLLLNLFVFGMDIQQAIDAARFRHLEGMKVALESAIPDSVRAALTSMGHVVSEGPGSMMGGSQAIIRLEHGYAAGSDPRKDGMAEGY
jgi:gamma-glutamyltranspeptidase / glutathione hydrolase